MCDLAAAVKNTVKGDPAKFTQLSNIFTFNQNLTINCERLHKSFIPSLKVLKHYLLFMADGILLLNKAWGKT